MAYQVVGYSDKEITFEHGPFVVCKVCGPGQCRVEVEAVCFDGTSSGRSIMPDITIYDLLKQCKFYQAGCQPFERVGPVVEWLNAQVKLRRITLVNGNWIAV